MMYTSITAARAAGLLIATLALGAALAPSSADARYGYRSGSYGYGYRYYGYRRGFEQNPDRLRFGSGRWWQAMDRANRGGTVGGSGSR
jgi:hypothetical protein